MHKFIFSPALKLVQQPFLFSGISSESHPATEEKLNDLVG